ncbi:hypothetical protein Lalb_Chr12g0205981 [Lupinus albus]|uniref:Uncharacterized protein n=1 Tax=Lupinus albus TaxID=3870 RepID=A0A6A4PP59_LUPAL|nr:hypothetical protein Lalb_Chr12g0205981 [Lupinus albus]
MHFMPIFISHRHFLDYLLDVLISCFYCPVHLRPIWGRCAMFDFEFFTHFNHHLVICKDPIFITRKFSIYFNSVVHTFHISL